MANNLFSKAEINALKESIGGDLSGSGVQDVQMNGESIAANGVANIPVASTGNLGVIRLGTARRGHTIFQGVYLIHETPNKANIKNRKNAEVSTMAVTLGALDDAIRIGFSDGVGASWTDTERLAALLRMGCTVDDNGFVKWTAQEVTV